MTVDDDFDSLRFQRAPRDCLITGQVSSSIQFCQQIVQNMATYGCLDQAKSCQLNKSQIRAAAAA
jgi:hypothetical protein